jgi:hypothetical protein
MNSQRKSKRMEEVKIKKASQGLELWGIFCFPNFFVKYIQHKF